MKNTNTPLLLAFATLTTVAIGLVTSANFRGAVSDCVGQPYGTPGCPLKSTSSASTPFTCGNAKVDAGEECDLGTTKNGFSNCTKSCTLLYCGDGLISPAIKEECEPESEELYALDPATGELVIEVRYLAPTCGQICTVPTCDEDGNCAGGCKRIFLPACVSSSSGNAQLAAGSSTSAPTTGSTAAALPDCGNGVVDGGEQCDDGNAVDIDACTNSCRIAVCGDTVVQLWEQCDDGNRVDADACSNSCKSPACGDGVVQSGEECDDGNQVNNDLCTNACKLPRCGDQLIQSGEECDDGNQVNSDTCSNACKEPRCGDMIVQQGEQCDDGNSIETDACTSQCVNARCGDMIVQQNEDCDDGNKANADGCSNLCKLPVCGNGVREGAETCDDGNESNNDACSNECQRPLCGDGFVQPGEFCDDGNQNNEDNCTTACRVPTCGDGLLHPREECDNGRDNSDTKADACRRDCREPRCGDAVTDEGEQCDGGEDCDESCKLLKPAAPVDVDWELPGYAPYGIALAIFGAAAVLAFVFRKKLHEVVANAAGEEVARSIDDIPLDEIEMPWHRWQ